MAEEKKWLTFDEIPIGSIWMAADGGSYGHYVVGKTSKERGDILVNAFTLRGWTDEEQRDINWWKLQYRYYRVA
jgi:hypothetical protein